MLKVLRGSTPPSTTPLNRSAFAKSGSKMAVAGLAGSEQRQRRAFAVDVVHGHAGMGGQEVRQKRLHTADGQRRGRVGQRDGTLAVGIGQAQTLVGHRRTAPLLLVPGVERGIQLLGTDAKHDAVDRLDLNGGAVDVADLGQAPARRMVLRCSSLRVGFSSSQ